MSYWQHWHYKNLTFVFMGILASLILSRMEVFHTFLLQLGTWGYIGAFIAGILFVNTFTVTTGILILFILTKYLWPIEIGIVAGLGAVAGDLIIFRFVKNNLEQELELIYNKVDSKHHIVKLFHSRYFHWTLPVLGAIIIASPLPDEMGVTLLGLSKMKTYEFIFVSFLLNSFGIFSIVSTSLLFKI